MGKRFVLVVLAVFLVGCGGSAVEDSQFVVYGEADGGAVPMASPTIMATTTPSVVPTATVNFEATAVIAQQTADEARRLNTQATAEYEQRVQEQLRLTAESEARVFEIYGWTATAALTAVPATATQQVVLNTQIAAQQTLVVVQATQTFEAPAKVIEMQQAEEYVQYAPLRQGVFAFFMLGMGTAMFFLAAWLRMQPQWSKAARDQMFEDYMKAEAQEQAEASAEAGVHHRVDVTKVELKDESGGYPKIQRFVVPCSPDALTELAQGLVSGAKGFGINSWEGSASENWTRARIQEMRHFLQLNKFADSLGGGRLNVNEMGKKFLLAWLESRDLPVDYKFVEKSSSIAVPQIEDVAGEII